MLVLSAIGHFVVLGALVLVPYYQRPKYVYLPSYTVNLVEVAPPASAPQPAAKPEVARAQPKAQTKPSPSPKKAEAKPSAEDKSKAKPKTPEKKPVPAQSVKIAPLEVKKWKPEVAPEPEETAPEAPAPPEPEPKAEEPGLAQLARTAVAPLPQPARSAMVDVDFPYGYYLAVIQNKIGENWKPSLDAYFSQETMRTVVTFEILRAGQIVNIELEASSGMELLDESACKAVEDSSPLPPLPGEFKEDRLRVHFNFEFTESG